MFFVLGKIRENVEQYVAIIQTTIDTCLFGLSCDGITKQNDICIG